MDDQSSRDETGVDRRDFMGVAAAGAIGAGALAGIGALGPASLIDDADAKKKKKKKKPKPKFRRLNPQTIGMQVYSMRAMIDHADYGGNGGGWDAALDALADSAYRKVEVGGSYYGLTPAEFREIVEQHGLTVSASHVPGGHGAFRDNLEQVYDDAETLGIRHVGIAFPHGDFISPRSAESYAAMAEEFNGFGEIAAARGLKFYFHNHPEDHTLDGGESIYNVLLRETDPRYVNFELDIAWAVAGGQSPSSLVAAHPKRFPLFHVKDLRWDENGNRTTPAGVANAGRKFFLTSVGKGDINFANIFRHLPNLNQHQYFMEDDDAGNLTVNPPGVVNFTWFSRRTLATMDIRNRKK